MEDDIEYIEKLYNFIDNPSLFINKNNDSISLFLNNNLIALSIIINAIDKDFMASNLSNLNKLNEALENELRYLSIDQYKIDICKNKLSSLVYKIELKRQKKVIENDIKMSSKLSGKYRNEISWNGYPSDIMKSGLQKYIRRGNLEKALYCGGELDLFKEASERGETIRTNFLHRLMIIFMEDVENMSLFNKIDKLANYIFNERDKSSRNKEKEEEWLYDIIYLLTISDKARVCSHIRAVFNAKYKKIHFKYPTIKKLWDEIEENELKIEKTKSKLENDCNLFKKYINEKDIEKRILCVYYAFQIDASEDKLKVKYFKSNKPVWFIFNQLLIKSSELKKDKEKIEKFVIWYKNHIGKMKEGFLCWLFPLLYIIGIIKEGKDINLLNNEDKNWDKNRNGHVIEIDEFVTDRHTKSGRGKGLTEFAIKGAFVENEASFVNLLWKRFYEDGKRYEDGIDIIGEFDDNKDEEEDKQDNKNKEEFDDNKDEEDKQDNKEEEKVPLETDEYRFIVLTQITTSGMKQDVYFAESVTDNKLVVVKGPYSSKKQIDVFLKNMEWKRKNNIPFIPFKIMKMIPNRWLDGIPLGFRNTIDRTKPAWFIIFDSVIEKNKIKTKMHSSKLWPETEVVDWSRILLHFDYKTGLISYRQLVDYVRAILFRFIRGISDFADRNFLIVNNRVISIDEDIEERNPNVYKELRKNKAEYLYRWLKNNYEKLDIQNWKGETEYEKEKLEIVKDKDKCLKLFKDE